MSRECQSLPIDLRPNLHQVSERATSFAPGCEPDFIGELASLPFIVTPLVTEQVEIVTDLVENLAPVLPVSTFVFDGPCLFEIVDNAIQKPPMWS